MQFGTFSFGVCGLAVLVLSMDDLVLWYSMLAIKGLRILSLPEMSPFPLSSSLSQNDLIDVH